MKIMKDIWNYPMRMNEAMWYLLLGFFMMIWMWMFIWA
jgi:hypothetical protein